MKTPPDLTRNPTRASQSSSTSYGDYIRLKRQLLNMRIQQLKDKIGDSRHMRTSISYLSQVERNVIIPPDSFLIHIAHALSLSQDEFSHLLLLVSEARARRTSPKKLYNFNGFFNT